MASTTIVVWQADGGTGHDLAFMYKPVMDTLVNGFADFPAEVASAAGPLQLLHGHGIGNLLRKHAEMVATLQTGDVFLWIGPVGSGQVPWRALRRRGVRTIYYQTEPFDGCQFGQVDVKALHEMWEFSWHNLDMCAPKLPEGVTLRYVPLGYSTPPAAEAAATPRPATGVPPADLYFFGYPFFKSGRAACYQRLQRRLGARLNATWSLWNADVFEEWSHPRDHTCPLLPPCVRALFSLSACALRTVQVARDRPGGRPPQPSQDVRVSS